MSVKMWPTPTAMNTNETPEHWEERRLEKKKQNINLHLSLGVAVQQEQKKMYTTPTAFDAIAGNMQSGFERPTTLVQTVQKDEKEKMWPTPQASDNRDRGNLGQEYIQRRKEKGKQLGLSTVVDKTSGALNPNWVEWLMGYPIGWTDI